MSIKDKRLFNTANFIAYACFEKMENNTDFLTLYRYLFTDDHTIVTTMHVKHCETHPSFFSIELISENTTQHTFYGSWDWCQCYWYIHRGRSKSADVFPIDFALSLSPIYGLAPTRQLSMIFTNDDTVYWQFYASSDVNKLNQSAAVKISTQCVYRNHRKLDCLFFENHATMSILRRIKWGERCRVLLEMFLLTDSRWIHRETNWFQDTHLRKFVPSDCCISLHLKLILHSDIVKSYSSITSI